MNKLQKWLLRKLIHTAVRERQTYTVVENLWTAAERRFYEDNIPTRYCFLLELLDDARREELRELEEHYGTPKIDIPT